MIVAGLDPGTTVGWAILDTEGKLIDVGSERGIDPRRLIAKIHKKGRVLAIGSDRAKTPSLVQGCATKLGARVFSPKNDVSIDDKRKVTTSFHAKNDHERDALASALFALKRIKPMIQRVQSVLLRRQKPYLFDDVIALVLREGISIHSALTILTEPVSRTIEVIEEVKPDADVVRLYSTITKLRKDNSLLLKKNQQIRNEVISLRNQTREIKEKMSQLVKPKSTSKIVKIKESQMVSLSGRLSSAEKLHNELKKSHIILERALLTKDKVAILRLQNLGSKELSSKKSFIKIGDCIFVDDPNQFSEKVINDLRKKKVQLVLCKKLPSKKMRSLLPFAFVEFKGEICNNIVLVKKNWLNEVRADRSMLDKILEEYKKERASLRM